MPFCLWADRLWEDIYHAGDPSEYLSNGTANLNPTLSLILAWTVQKFVAKLNGYISQISVFEGSRRTNF
jgi:hypothetical protein